MSIVHCFKGVVIASIFLTIQSQLFSGQLHDVIAGEISDQKPELVQELLLSGANPNELDLDGCSPLHVLVEKCEDAVELVFEKEGKALKVLMHDLRAIDAWLLHPGHSREELFSTPLFEDLAAEAPFFSKYGFHPYSFEIAYHLLKAGADKNSVDSEGRTPISIACQLQRHMLADFIKYADIYADISGSDVVAVVKEFLDTYEIQFRKELLFREIVEGRLCGVEKHLKAGVDPNIRDEQGRTPLHVAAQDGKDAVDIFLTNGNKRRIFGQEIMAYFSADPRGSTQKLYDDGFLQPDEKMVKFELVPLSKHIMTLLVNYGADATLVDSQGKTAADIEAEKKQDFLIDISIAILFN